MNRKLHRQLSFAVVRYAPIECDIYLVEMKQPLQSIIVKTATSTSNEKHIVAIRKVIFCNGFRFERRLFFRHLNLSNH